MVVCTFQLTLLFSKESAMATETPRFATLTTKNNPRTIEQKKSQSMDSHLDNAEKSNQKKFSEMSVTTLSSYSSLPSECSKKMHKFLLPFFSCHQLLFSTIFV